MSKTYYLIHNSVGTQIHISKFKLKAYYKFEYVCSNFKCYLTYLRLEN